LHQHRGEDHEYRHLQELALQVFEQGFPGMSGRQIVGHDHLGFVMGNLRFVELSQPGPQLAHEKDQEHRHQQ
jgi:hypothetical protein